MTEQIGTVLVIAKQPLPGRVKTRLTPPFSAEQAAQLAAAALSDTLRAAARIPARQHVLVLDGCADAIATAGWRVIAQGSGSLADRLSDAFDAVAGDGPAVLVGMDTPQFRAEQVSAFRPGRFDCCLGMAADGGFWVIGFTDPGWAHRVIPGVAMSTDTTGAQQLQRLVAQGLSVQLLEELVDFDTVESARTVAALAPNGEFARSLAGMRPTEGSTPSLVPVSAL